MATSLEFVEYVCDQLSGLSEIRYRKMFGEYMIYINNKPIVLICDNIVYVKEKKEIHEWMKKAEKRIPYKGAKEHYVLDIEDKELCFNVLRTLEEITPLPKPKMPKSK